MSEKVPACVPDKVLYGSVLFLLCNNLLQDAPPEKNLQKIVGDIKEAYQKLGIPHQNRFAGIQMSMLSVKGSMKLKGTANEVRHLGRPLHEVWKKYSWIVLE